MRSNPSDNELMELLLEASMQHMRATMETMPIGMIQLSGTGIIKSIDQETERVLGFTENSLQGSSITVLLYESGFEFLKQLAAADPSFNTPLLLRSVHGTCIATQAAVTRDQTALHRVELTLTFIQIPEVEDRGEAV